jgi:hypothetical protein
MTLEEDWKRVEKAFTRYKQNHWNPQLIYSINIYDLRKFDRGIDYPLRRLLESKEYGNNLRLFGAPTPSGSEEKFGCQCESAPFLKTRSSGKDSTWSNPKPQ